MFKKVFKKYYRKKKQQKIKRKLKRSNGITSTNNTQGFRIMNALSTKIMTFKRTTLSLSIGQPTTLGNVSGTIVFRLSDLPSVTEFTSLFNKFRLKAVKITYRLQDNPIDGSYQPTIYSWKNYNIALAGAILPQQLQQLPNVHVLQTSEDARTLTHTIKPYLVLSTFNGGFIQSTQKWVDMNYASTAQYYGIAYLIENMVGSGDQSIRLTYDLEYTIECMSQF